MTRQSTVRRDSLKPLARLTRAEQREFALTLTRLAAIGGWYPLRLLKALTMALPADRESFLAIRSLLAIVPD